MCIDFIVLRRKSSALTSPPTRFAKLAQPIFGRPMTYPTPLTMSLHPSEPTCNNLSSSRKAIEAESSGEDAQAATARYLLTPADALLNPLRLNMVTSVSSSQSLNIPSTPSDMLEKKARALTPLRAQRVSVHRSHRIPNMTHVEAFSKQSSCTLASLAINCLCAQRWKGTSIASRRPQRV